MAMFPLHHEFPCKDHAFQHRTSTGNKTGQMFSSARTFPCPAFDVLMKAAVTSSCTSGLKHSTTALGRDCRVKKSYIRSIPYCLVDQSQNKEMIKGDEFEDLFQKAIVMTGIGLILSHFGPIDDWTNLGALVAGIVYGYFTCPVLQFGKGSERPEGIVTVGQEK
ncbi:hypothetical protein Rs2_45567 [Raphanus sativus]|uniref:Uncharacterized protein LOC130501674 n=1 Tax=Raphanus sativus TaxID=3726 RepID=A0A9W3CLI8_RAPSA|nr:uncharacterized protein LOC130501674 [Raphanus sativus]KAJ4872763.1 hypothetical protein Rs2_45567 [Raphanus sativus]